MKKGILRNAQRRDFCLGILGMLMGFFPIVTSAQIESPVTKINRAASNAKIVTENLRGKVSVLSGSGGNITVFASPEGKYMVDAGLGVSCSDITAALGKLSSQPVKYLVNTHWHWDHTDGNKCIHDQGATIIAQQNTANRLSVATRVEDWNFTFDPWPVSARPTVIVKRKKKLNFGGEKILMMGFGPGHTDSDIIVYFQKADVMVLGDIFWNGAYPFIDNSTGGSIDGAIRLADAAIMRVTAKTIVVPGHGPVGDRSQLIEFRNMLVGIRGNIMRLKEQGKTLDEIIAARPTASYDAKWGGFVIDPDFFTRLVYNSLNK